MKANSRAVWWLMGAGLAGAVQAAGPSAATNAGPRVVLPLGRAHYFAGEPVLLAVAAPEPAYEMSWRDAQGQAVLMTARSATRTWLIETACLAPGPYAVYLDGQPSGVEIGLTSPLRSSCGALTDESANLVPPRPEDRAAFQSAVRESGITALLPPANYAQPPPLDDLAAAGALFFGNPTTRIFSFCPARVYAPELSGYHLRLALYAQAYGRYPNFAGYWYDWDAASLQDMATALIQYYGFGKEEQSFRTYSGQRDQALRAEFAQRTGLLPPTEDDFRRYCFASGRREFAPIVDYPAFQWTREIARTMPPLSTAAVADLATRCDAWSQYLMGVLGEAYAAHQAVLRDVDPSLRNSSSVSIDHGPVRLGHWHPGAYAPLDFRYCTAWADGDNPGYRYQWLLTAAILDIGRPPDQPVWLGSFLGTTFSRARYPGNFMLQAAQILAYGGRGLGLSFEGFSTLLSSMNAASTWANLKGTAGEQDLVAGREFLRRFAALGAACRPVHKVGILYSQRQMMRQNLTQSRDSFQARMFFTLARLGYSPAFVTEQMILADGLAGYQALVVLNQSVPLPEEVLAKLKTLTAAGGKLVVDQASTVALPDAVTIAVNLPYKPLGAPHNWSFVNNPEGVSTAVSEEREHAALAPAVYAGHECLSGMRLVDAECRLSSCR